MRLKSEHLYWGVELVALNLITDTLELELTDGREVRLLCELNGTVGVDTDGNTALALGE